MQLLQRRSASVMASAMATSQRISLALGRFHLRYRRGAATVALGFPLVFVTFLIGGLSKGPEALTTHPLLLASLLPGVVAMLIWVKRYCRPAVIALRNRNEPVAMDGDCVTFFGRTFPLSEADTLLVQRKTISLLHANRVVAVEPTFFVKSPTWGLNQSSRVPESQQRAILKRMAFGLLVAVVFCAALLAVLLLAPGEH